MQLDVTITYICITKKTSCDGLAICPGCPLFVGQDASGFRRWPKKPITFHPEIGAFDSKKCVLNSWEPCQMRTLLNESIDINNFPSEKYLNIKLKSACIVLVVISREINRSTVLIVLMFLISNALLSKLTGICRMFWSSWWDQLGKELNSAWVHILY